MKKLLLGLFVFGSMSSFACDWAVKEANIKTYKKLASEINNVQIDNWNNYLKEELVEMNMMERELLLETYDVLEGECELNTSLITDAELVLRQYSK